MLNRRRFIHQVSGGAAALAGSSVFPPASILGANDRVRFGLIGAGGRGLDIFKHALRAPNSQAIAVADVYTRRLEEAKQLAPTVQTFTDFRRLLDDKRVQMPTVYCSVSSVLRTERPSQQRIIDPVDTALRRN